MPDQGPSLTARPARQDAAARSGAIRSSATNASTATTRSLNMRCGGRWSVLESHTMTAPQPLDQQQLGQRIADARIEDRLTQADLAAAIGLDRTAVAKIEAGTRKVSAVELVKIAAELKRSLDWFLLESPQAVISRRAAEDAGKRTIRLDRAIDKVSRDVEFLLEAGVLELTPTAGNVASPRGSSEAEQRAERVRKLLGLGEGPLLELDRVAEQLGLLCFSLALGGGEGDGAYVSLGEVGVTVINGDAESGRRRFTLAHEIGHHIFSDEYSVDLTLAEVGSETERRLNAFAVHLLLPRSSVAQRWRAWTAEPREKSIRLGIEYRVSWSALCSHLKNLELITEDERQSLLARPPTRADYLELGMSVVEELRPPAVSPRYARAVLRAYRSGRLGASRTVDLLWGSVTRDDLPQLDVVPIDALQRELDAL
jgi:Zn-dependent peptidase ImmA (M78 family)/DNA-binding XRE family transcriptional regulator